MAGKYLRKIFFIAFLVPYFIIFLLAAAFIWNISFKINELSEVQKLSQPVENLSKLIVLLNRDKVFKIVKAETGELYCPLLESHKKRLKQELEQLEQYLLTEKSWQKYCNCDLVLNLNQQLQRLNSKNITSPKDFLRAYDDLINKLCAYYAQLSSVFRLKIIGLQFKTLYTLHKFHTVVTDLTAEYFSALEGFDPDFNYSHYYYTGEILAYADTYYTLIDIPHPKELFAQKVYNHPFLQQLLSESYKSPEQILKGFIGFEHLFWDYQNELLTLLQSKIDKLLKKYKLQLLEIIFLAILSFLSLILVNFVLYQYGLTKFERLIQKLELKTLKDPLTGLFNRRFFNIYLLTRLQTSIEEDKPVSFILLDIDNFKKLNDTHGHAFGDKVLRHVARILRQSIRKEDVALRWGGEEFGIFVNAPLEEAKKLAERIRKRLEESPVDGVKITASFGVGEYRGEDPKEFFQKVDQALYRAKKMGKNRVEVAE